MDGVVTKFGVCLETSRGACYIGHGWGTYARTYARVDVPLFRISETAGRIALKFGMWLETHKQGFLQKLYCIVLYCIVFDITTHPQFVCLLGF